MRLATRVLATVLASAFAITSLPGTAFARPMWDTSPVVVERAPRPTPRVVDLRYAEHANFDRVVIDVKGKLPGYNVRYVRVLRRDGSGDVVHLPGRRSIQITLNPAQTFNAAGDNVYKGPRHKRLHFDTLRGVAFLSDFEGYVNFGLGLDHRADFRVLTLDDPTRIVVDMRH